MNTIYGRLRDAHVCLKATGSLPRTFWKYPGSERISQTFLYIILEALSFVFRWFWCMGTVSPDPGPGGPWH